MLKWRGVYVFVCVDSSTDDELIALGHERFDDTNLGGHLGTTNDGSEGALRAGEGARERASDWKESKAGRAGARPLDVIQSDNNKGKHGVNRGSSSTWQTHANTREAQD
jgi:hypothetical protein